MPWYTKLLSRVTCFAQDWSVQNLVILHICLNKWFCHDQPWPTFPNALFAADTFQLSSNCTSNTGCRLLPVSKMLKAAGAPMREHQRCSATLSGKDDVLPAPRKKGGTAPWASLGFISFSWPFWPFVAQKQRSKSNRNARLLQNEEFCRRIYECN